MVNVDRSPTSKADVLADLSHFPWPFKENTFNNVRAEQLVEHLPPETFYQFMLELNRVCCSGALVQIRSPHGLSDNFCTDPTHQFRMTVRTFDFLDPSKALYVNGQLYGWTGVKLQVLSAELIANPPNGPDVTYLLQILKETDDELELDMKNASMDGVVLK